MATSNGTPAAAPAAKPALVYESLLSSFAAKRSGDGAEAHKKVADAYTQLWAADGVEEGKDVQVRKQNSKDMVNYYYDMVTDFYEYGWGESFHFARLFSGDSFAACMLRHEEYLALKLGLKRGDKVLDVGCGVGGPMRNVVRLSNADVTGINNNVAQVNRTNAYAKKRGLESLCRAQHGDFLNMPFEDNTFDAIYSIEATCHAPQLVTVFKEIYRVLKPGQLYANYEWCTTAKYDPENEEQWKIIRAIEEGDSLPKLVSIADADAAAREAGFEIVETEDLAEGGPGQEPWWSVLVGGYSYQKTLEGVMKCGLMSPWGRWITDKFSRVLETVGIAPPGTCRAHEVLELAAQNLAKGGEKGIFTPMYFMLLRKPLN